MRSGVPHFSPLLGEARMNYTGVPHFSLVVGRSLDELGVPHFSLVLGEVRMNYTGGAPLLPGVGRSGMHRNNDTAACPTSPWLLGEVG